MIKNKLKNEKGISLVSLVVATIVLVILSNVIVYSTRDNLKIGNLKEMQNDIANLRDKISSYYAQNGKIPAKLKYTNINHLKDAGILSDTGDTGNFLVIDLSALDNLTLNRGQDYSKIKEWENPSTDDINGYTDLYIINETSHNIFYVAGIKIGEEIFYTDYTDKDIDKVAVDLRYVDNVKIPDNFYYAGGTKDTGIVISDVPGDDLENAKQGNQFVWVPVDPNEFKRIEGYENGNKQSLLSECEEPSTSGYQGEQEEYEKMYESVIKNKGFYIGRYEAGKDANENVVVKKNAKLYNWVPWGNAMNDIEGTSNTSGKLGAVKLAKEFCQKLEYTDVTSSLIYGIQWDATMQFIDPKYSSGKSDETSYVRNSSDRGNYDGSTIETGSNDDYAIKNIYDMAGNAWEWTMEDRSTDKRVIRRRTLL